MITKVYLVPLGTAPRPRSMAVPLQFRLPERRHSECRFNNFTIFFKDLLFAFFLSAATVPCCTGPVTAAAAALLRLHKSCYYTDHTTGPITPRHVCTQPSTVFEREKVQFSARDSTSGCLSSFSCKVCDPERCFHFSISRHL